MGYLEDMQIREEEREYREWLSRFKQACKILDYGILKALTDEALIEEYPIPFIEDDAVRAKVRDWLMEEHSTELLLEGF